MKQDILSVPAGEYRFVAKRECLSNIPGTPIVEAGEKLATHKENTRDIEGKKENPEQKVSDYLSGVQGK